MLYSDDDIYVPKKSKEKYREYLDRSRGSITCDRMYQERSQGSTSRDHN